MPNGRTHTLAGTVLGAFASLVAQDKFGDTKQIDIGHLLLSTGTGAAFGRLPDILEPPLHPNHRAFFHSFAFGAVLGFGGVEVWKILEEKAAERKTLGVGQISGTELLLWLALIVIGVVLLHLLMDSFTKKSLPIV